MSVDTATVRHIAKLARIAVTDGEVEALVPELNTFSAGSSNCRKLTSAASSR
jgi:Asp-tRNA(Asn)/Glu-tRNA(Gln) amidotransferase C subunit